MASALRAGYLNHWTTTKVPSLSALMILVQLKASRLAFPWSDSGAQDLLEDCAKPTWQLPLHQPEIQHLLQEEQAVSSILKSSQGGLPVFFSPTIGC